MEISILKFDFKFQINLNQSSVDPYQVIIAPVISHKAVSGQGLGQYQFLVHQDATKTDVWQAVSEIYGVKINGVNMSIRPGKTRRRGRGLATVRRQVRKKAIVTLKSGEVLDPGKVYAQHKDDKK